MVSTWFLWGNVIPGGEPLILVGSKNSNFEFFENALYVKSGSMTLVFI